MSNPWLKKNPFMSMWLSGANAVSGSARSRITAQAKRQTTAAANKAAGDMFSAWTHAMTNAMASTTTPAAAPKRRRKR